MSTFNRLPETFGACLFCNVGQSLEDVVFHVSVGKEGGGGGQRPAWLALVGSLVFAGWTEATQKDSGERFLQTAAPQP